MKNFKNKSGTSGFTLVELSIVIVIIGFLVAGIAAGSNMVKQAQIRSVISDFQSYQTSYNGFVGRYNKAPGDLNVASSYWPAVDGSQCVENGGTLSNCDGDGDGLIENGYNSGTDEIVHAWRHLYLSGFVSSGSDVIPDTRVALNPGVNVPAGALAQGGFFMAGTFNLSRNICCWNNGFGEDTTDYLMLGQTEGGTAGLTRGSATPEEAFSIDAKIDDGVVDSSGDFIGFDTGKFKVQTGDASPVCINAGTYVISATTSGCLIGMALE